MTTDATLQEVAAALHDAEASRKPIEPLAARWPDLDVTDAYRIQLHNIERRVEAGAAVRGHKVGLSSPAMQQMMGVDEPARDLAPRMPAVDWPERFSDIIRGYLT